MAPQYGEVRVDYITYTTGVVPNEGNATAYVSGLINNPTFSGNVIIKGNATIDSNLNVAGDITASGNAIIEGNTTIDGNLNVSGDITTSGNVIIEGNTTIDGNLNVSGDINASGVVISGFTGLFDSGTEAAPSISFEDDQDTGIYNPLANQLGISVSGVEKIRINQSGYVGLGVDLSWDPNVLLAPLQVDNLNGAASAGQAAIIHCNGINDRRFKLASLKGTSGVSQATIGSLGCFYNPSGNTEASGYVTNAVIDFKRGGSSDNGYIGFTTASGNAGFIYSNGNWVIGDKESMGNSNDSNTTALHIYKPDPILTIQDTDTVLATSSAGLRLANSNSNTHVNTYWDIRADRSNSQSPFSFVINNKDNADNNSFVITRDGNVGISYYPTPVGVAAEALVVGKQNQGIRVQNIVYTANQDAPYLIASTSFYTGATTNWGTHGFQHRFKSNSGGTSRITIDTYLGEFFCMNNAGNSSFGGADKNPDLPFVVSKTSQEILARFENNITAAGSKAGIELRHGGTNQCRAAFFSERDGLNAGAGYLLQSSNTLGNLADRYRCTELGRHSIYGSNFDLANATGTLTISQATTGISTVGSGPIIHLVGWDGSSPRSYAAIAALKSNGTTNNFDGVLAFYTRRNGVTDLDERGRFNKDGFFGINTQNPERLLHIYQSAATDYNITAYLARGSDSNFLIACANGENSNATGKRVGRFGSYYKGGATPGWDTSIDFVRGSGEANGTIRFQTAGSTRLQLTTTTVEVSGTLNTTSSINAQNAIQITGPAPILYLTETGTGISSKKWSVVRDGNAFSIRWNNSLPYAMQATIVSEEVNEVRLRGNTFAVDANGRINLGQLANPSAEANSVCCAGRLQSAGSYSGTTANAANLNINASGIILRSTSSIRFKTEVETLEDTYADALLNCRPVWYRSTSETDRSDYSHYGFIAEEVAEIDPRLVHWEENEFVTESTSHIENSGPDETTTKIVKLNKAVPGGVAYDRFVPALINLIKRQKDAINKLEERLNKLENKL